VRQVPARGAEQVRLVDEVQRAVLDDAQPAVVRPADPLAVHAPRELLDWRGHLDVARARDALQLRADEDRVAQVLEGVRADGEVELPVVERPRLARAEVALHPCVLAEALGVGVAVVAPQAARGVGLEVEDPVRARERLGPAADVEDERVVGDLA